MKLVPLLFLLLINLGPLSAQTTWAERLGFPADAIVLILHADDIGMCEEANMSAKNYMESGHIQSGAVMMPCDYAVDMIQWAKEHPNQDIGLHLTLTSEWKTWRWPSLTPVEQVPGLIDPEGNMWRSVREVATHASPEEVASEIRAQMEKAISLGYRPNHIDTHMGTLYAHPLYTKAYLDLAEEFQIPAMVIDLEKPGVVEAFRSQGYPLNDEMIGYINAYSLPKLDYFYSAPNGENYEDKCQKFFELIDSIEPGLTEIIFHPSVESENLKTITNSWKQRVWEAKMFADPKVKQYLQDKGIIFTNWKEVMERFKG